MKKNSFLIIQFLSEILDRQKMAGISVRQNSRLELAVLGKEGLAAWLAGRPAGRPAGRLAGRLAS